MNTSDDPGYMILNIGAPGTMKTGALACLINAGYHVRIADFDGLAWQVLRNYIRPELHDLQRSRIRRYADKMKAVGGNITVDGVPKAFASFMSDLDKWDGGINSWPVGSIFVLDTLTRAGDAKMREVLYLAGKIDQQSFDQALWGMGQMQFKRLFEFWKFGGLTTTIIVNTHYKWGNPDSSSAKPGEDPVQIAIPTSVGTALGHELAGFFSVVLGFSQNRGSDQRTINTLEIEGIRTKIPAALPAKLPATDGLLTVFKALGIHPPKETASAV